MTRRADAKTSAPVPLIDLKAQYARLKSRIDGRLRKVLEHGRFILGPEVAELEAGLAEFTGAAHAIAVANGTDALKIALMAEGVGPGDAVFLPAFSFVATAEVVVALGAQPIFCDVDPARFTLDTADLARRIEKLSQRGPLKPRAVVPVDLFGLPADYPAIQEIAERHGLFVLADSAQSFGASLGGVRVGRLARLTATSFHPSKPLGCYGDGGCLFTDDPGLAEIMDSIHRHGVGPGGEKAVRVGLNSRLDTIQAAVLLAKLEAFEAELEARAEAAGRYDAQLSGLVTLPVPPPEAKSAHAVYAILTDRRDAVREALRQAGIATRIYYPTPLHAHPAFASFGEGPGSLPVSEDLTGRILSLPMHPDLDAVTIERICEAVTQAIG